MLKTKTQLSLVSLKSMSRLFSMVFTVLLLSVLLAACAVSDKNVPTEPTNALTDASSGLSGSEETEDLEGSLSNSSSEPANEADGWIDKKEGWTDLLVADQGNYKVVSWQREPETDSSLISYGLVEERADGKVRILSNDLGPLSPFYSLNVIYQADQTFVWGLTKDEGWVGKPGLISVNPEKATLTVGESSIEQDLVNKAFLFIVDGYVQPDELLFYDQAGEEQGGTKYPEMGLTFDMFPPPNQ